MSKIVDNSTRVVAYLPSLRTFLHRLRATSKTPSTLAPTLLSTTPPSVSIEKTEAKATSRNSYQLPGSACHLETAASLGLCLNDFVFPGAAGHSSQEHNEAEQEEEVKDNSSRIDSIQTVEFHLQDCPEFLHDQFMQLFPDVSQDTGQLRILTLCEKTHNDMSGWSQSVEEEREELLVHFIDSAKEICSRLVGAGYWADFIDPSSGRAFYGQYTHNTLYETDERFKYLGFDILDLGCCKCITHPLWGTHTFIGTIFTNAPINSSPLQQIVNL